MTARARGEPLRSADPLQCERVHAMAQLVLQRGREVERVLLERGAAVASQARLGEIGELPRQLLGG